MAENWGQLSELPLDVQQPLRHSTSLTAVITLISLIALFIVQPEIPLFYSMPTDEVLVSKLWLLLFPILALILSIVHIALTWVARDFQHMVLRLYAWTTVVLLALLLVTLIRMLWLII